MRLAPKTIYGKGLVLICLPLLMEVAFGLSMFALQRYYGMKLAHERTAVEIIFHANEMWINCTETLLSKANFNLFGGPRPPIEETTNRLREEYKVLSPLVVGDSEQRETLERVYAWSLQILRLLDQLEPVMSEQQSSSRKMAILMSNLDILKQVQILVDRVADEIEMFRDPEFLHSSSAISEVDSATALLDRVIIGSLAASTLVAMMLLAYFIRSINQGIQLVVDNTERFKQGVALKPPAESGDELARVDAAFHEMAKEINEAQRTKQSIVSMISHDLRSPLTSVQGYLFNVEDGVFGDVSPETIFDVQKCERGVEELIRLINNLLDLDKIEAGRFEIRPRSLAIEDVIGKATASVTSFAEENRVRIESAESSAEAYADPDRIVQALTNVLWTAVRLAPAGSHVKASADRYNGEAQITVTSAGAHMPADELESLFDRYQRSESGLRLELAISREIVRLHGGSSGATVDSSQGITFWLRLPSAQPAPVSESTL